MKKTNAEIHAEEMKQNPEFRAQYLLLDIAADLASQVRTAREAQHLSQTDLAHLMDTTQSQISRYENPLQARYSLQTLARLAVHLNCNLQISITPAAQQIGDAKFWVGFEFPAAPVAPEKSNTVTHTLTILDRAA